MKNLAEVIVLLALLFYIIKFIYREVISFGLMPISIEVRISEDGYKITKLSFPKSDLGWFKRFITFCTYERNKVYVPYYKNTIFVGRTILKKEGICPENKMEINYSFNGYEPIPEKDLERIFSYIAVTNKSI